MNSYDNEAVLRVAWVSHDIDAFLDGWMERHGDERACDTVERLLRLLVSEFGVANLRPGCEALLRGSAEIDDVHSVYLTVRLVDDRMTR